MFNKDIILFKIHALKFPRDEETQCRNELTMYSTLFTTTSAGFIGKLGAELSKCRLNNGYNNISHV